MMSNMSLFIHIYITVAAVPHAVTKHNSVIIQHQSSVPQIFLGHTLFSENLLFSNIICYNFLN